MRIYLTYEVWQKYMAYMRLADGEISGIGRSHLDDDNNVVMTDLWIWEQECTGATTEVVDHEAMFELVAELVGQGIPMEELNVWWHSHVDMGAFFSGTDKQTIEDWINNRYLVAIVGNRRSEFKGTIAIKSPIPCDLEADVEVQYPALDTTIEETIKAEIAEKVSVKKYPAVAGFQDRGKKQKHFGGSWGDDDYHDNEVKWATNCGCSECKAYLGGKREKFPYKTHEYCNGIWINPAIPNALKYA